MHKYNLKVDKTSRFGTPKNCFSNTPSKPLPAVVDLRSKFKTIYDQGTLGSCTAQAGAAAYKYLSNKFNPSRLFIYYNERLMDGDVENDSGSSLSQCINALKMYGVCSEELLKYEIEKFAIKPSDQCYNNGLKHKVVEADRLIQTRRALKESLVNGNPFILGIAVYESFESENVTKTGIVPMPLPNEHLLGYHAVVCVGYSNEQKHWIMLNSWSDGWGDKGFFYLPYEYLTEENLSSDIWVIKKINNKLF